MYHNIKEFREFIANASDEQIIKAITFINIQGFIDRNCIIKYDERYLAAHAIQFAKSDYILPSAFLAKEIDIFKKRIDQ